MKNNAWLWGLLLAIGSVWLLLASNKVSPTADLVLTSSAYAGGWSNGSESAKAVLVEYADFQCPACRFYSPTIKQLAKDFGDNLKIVYRFFPLTQIHMNALSSAEAAEAAGLQGKFWEMHDLLFENQDTWKNLANPTEIFISYAKTIGSDIPKFKADMSSSSVLQSIKESNDSALKLGLQGTPTFFLNGVRIDNPRNYDEFKATIQEAISA